MREEKSRHKSEKRAVLPLINSSVAAVTLGVMQQDVLSGVCFGRNSNKIFTMMIVSDLEFMHPWIFPGLCCPHRNSPSFYFVLSLLFKEWVYLLFKIV